MHFCDSGGAATSEGSKEKTIPPSGPVETGSSFGSLFGFYTTLVLGSTACVLWGDQATVEQWAIGVARS